MLHDYLGVNRSTLQEFEADVEAHLVYVRKTWRHRNNNNHTDSLSLIIDKYFASVFEAMVKSHRPKTSIFAQNPDPRNKFLAKNKSIFDLLVGHRLNKYLLRTDVFNYFHSITFETIKDELESNAQTKTSINIIQKLYFNEGHLRIGLVGSPAISELVGLKIDRLIQKLKSKEQVYSRYYDDIIITGNSKYELYDLQNRISVNLKNSLNLDIKNNKTKVKILNGSNILGLVFFGGELTVPKKFKYKIRALEYVYSRMAESSEGELREKMSVCGSIYASLYRIVNNSTLDMTAQNASIDYYGREFYRLKQRLLALMDDPPYAQYSTYGHK